MSKSNKRPERMTKYAYLRDERDPRRVMTIARRWGKNGNKMHYAYTICNPVEDQFRKATGRDEATRRMDVNPTKIKPEQGEFILRAIILDIATRNVMDDHCRNATAMANQWLDENDRRMEEDYLRIVEEQDNDHSGCETACGDAESCNGECGGCDCEDLDSVTQEELVEKIKAIRKNLGGSPMSYSRPSSSRRCD